ncbi:hypothetical protein FNH09_07430 [Streptomyces adustus]|uniref:Uncharacterized protein n=1 Tax=Streptomyces adustus TaxID=1609272 RepID=A0A5N8V7A8_9ACTN|nr:hypothetical protein [Streptomyces adustus]MPY31151.1 hypothetical protein [Streptomyces adustus]
MTVGGHPRPEVVERTTTRTRTVTVPAPRPAVRSLIEIGQGQQRGWPREVEQHTAIIARIKELLAELAAPTEEFTDTETCS